MKKLLAAIVILFLYASAQASPFGEAISTVNGNASVCAADLSQKLLSIGGWTAVSTKATPTTESKTIPYVDEKNELYHVISYKYLVSGKVTYSPEQNESDYTERYGVFGTYCSFAPIVNGTQVDLSSDSYVNIVYISSKKKNKTFTTCSLPDGGTEASIDGASFNGNYCNIYRPANRFAGPTAANTLVRIYKEYSGE